MSAALLGELDRHLFAEGRVGDADNGDLRDVGVFYRKIAPSGTTNCTCRNSEHACASEPACSCPLGDVILIWVGGLIFPQIMIERVEWIVTMDW